MLRNQSIFTSHEDNTTPSKTQQGRFSVSARRSSTAASRAVPEAADAGRLARPATLCINTQRSSLYRAMIWPAATCAVRCMIGLAVAPRMRTSQGAQRSGVNRTISEASPLSTAFSTGPVQSGVSLLDRPMLSKISDHEMRTKPEHPFLLISPIYEFEALHSKAVQKNKRQA